MSGQRSAQLSAKCGCLTILLEPIMRACQGTEYKDSHTNYGASASVEQLERSDLIMFLKHVRLRSGAFQSCAALPRHVIILYWYGCHLALTVSVAFPSILLCAVQLYRTASAYIRSLQFPFVQRAKPFHKHDTRSWPQQRLQAS